MSARLKAWLLLIGVFVLGGATGSGATFAYSQQKSAELLRNPGDDSMESRRVAALAERLELDTAQQAQVMAIMTGARDDIRAINREMASQDCARPLRERREKISAQIRDVLRPEQQKKYDALFQRR